MRRTLRNVQHCLRSVGLAVAIIPGILTAQELPSGFSDSMIVGGLANPVGLASVDDSTWIVIEQYTSVVHAVTIGQRRMLDTLGVISDVNPDGNERGLLGVAIDPEFTRRPFAYFYFTGKNEHCNLVRYRLTRQHGVWRMDPRSRYIILNDIPDHAWNHNGGGLRFGPDGMLYVSIGEDATPCAAQALGDFRGKVLRLDLSHLPESAGGPSSKDAIAAQGNPFVGRGNGVDSLIWLSGLRNPFRFHIDNVAGDLYIADVGQLEIEEIDRSLFRAGGGENYGWPFREGPKVRSVTGCDDPGGTGAPTFTGPIAWYDRSGFEASVISLCLYRAPRGANASHSSIAPWPGEYDGDYFFVDYYKGFVRRIERDSVGRWVPGRTVAGQPDARNWATGYKTVADAVLGSDGSLYYVRQVDDNFSPNSGQLRKIVFVGAPGER